MATTPSNWIHLQNTNFAPRIGFAYSRSGDERNFVVRAGFGIFYDNLSLATLVNNLGNQLPFVSSTCYTNPSNTVPSLTFANPFPAGETVPTIPTPSESSVTSTLPKTHNGTYP